MNVNIEAVPILPMVKELYQLPIGKERFQKYLSLFVSPDGQTIHCPPLVVMNPMAKAHVAEIVDELLNMNAEEILNDAANLASKKLVGISGNFKIGLSLADDAMGGWTNRYTTDADSKFKIFNGLKYGWVNVMLWSSEPCNAKVIQRETLKSVFRSVYVQQLGNPKTLRHMLQQEGLAWLFAEELPSLEADDLELSRSVITEFLDSQDYPIQFACLYGDKAANALGYSPLGLSNNAGFELALADAMHEDLDPVSFLRKTPIP